MKMYTTTLQQHKEVGLIQKAFWCMRDEDSPLLWRTHEIYFMVMVLVLPGSIMGGAYMAIIRRLCQCMRERQSLLPQDQPVYYQTENGDVEHKFRFSLRRLESTR